MSYNGWKNYETWCVALWLDNDPGSHFMAKDIATDTSMRDYDKAKEIMEIVETANPLNNSPATMFTDLLNGALSEVDWREVLEHYQED